MSVTLTINNKLTSKIKKIKQKLANVPKEAYKVFSETTPVKTGNAKRKTRLKGSTIVADYEYAEVLDKGRHMTTRGMRGSKQAPKGMSKPTEDFIRKRVKDIFKGK